MFHKLNEAHRKRNSSKKIKTLGFVKSNLAYVPKTGLKEKAAVNSCGLYQGKKKLARK